MIFLLSLVIGLLFGSGFYLMLKRDLIRTIIGVVLLSNAVNLFIVSAGLTLGVAPIYPLESIQNASDPLAQALVLTAVVINFGVSTFALILVYQVFKVTHTLDEFQLEHNEKETEQNLAQEEKVE